MTPSTSPAPLTRRRRPTLPAFAIASLFALAQAGCTEAAEIGIRIGVQNSTAGVITTEISVSSGGSGLMTQGQGYQSTIVEGDVGDEVEFTVTLPDDTSIMATCTATASIVGPDEMQAEYGQLTVGLFQPGSQLFAECSSGWLEGPT